MAKATEIPHPPTGPPKPSNQPPTIEQLLRERIRTAMDTGYSAEEVAALLRIYVDTFGAIRLEGFVPMSGLDGQYQDDFAVPEGVMEQAKAAVIGIADSLGMSIDTPDALVVKHLAPLLRIISAAAWLVTTVDAAGLTCQVEIVKARTHVALP